VILLTGRHPLLAIHSYTLLMSRPTRLSAGVVVVRDTPEGWRFLLLRAFTHWDFPKGMVEAGEEPLAAAIREVKEETLIEELTFAWGHDFIETGPYSRGKVARYYLARTSTVEVSLPVIEELGRPEHNEYRWVDEAAALKLVSARVEPIVNWASKKLQEDTLKTPTGDSLAEREVRTRNA
jgi:8-oxo-dGTP pyrophosphatase MutT (NUDIX family)